MKRLRNLRVREVSLVKSPANKKKFIVYKSADKGGAMSQPSKAEDAVRGLDDAKMAPIYKAVEERRLTIKADGTMPTDDMMDQAAQDAGLSPAAQTQLRAIGRIIATNADEISVQDVLAVCQAAGIDCSDVDMGDSDGTAEDPEIELSEADEASGQDADKAEDEGEKPGEDVGGDLEVDLDADKPDDVTESDHAEAMDKAKQAYQAHVADKKKPKALAVKPATAGSKGGKPTMKSAAKDNSSPSASAELQEVQKAQKRLEETNRQLVEKNAQLEAEVRQERDHRVLKSMEREVAEQFPALGLESAKVARVLKSFKDAGQTEAHDEYVAVLKAANAQVELSKATDGNLFGAMGRTVNGTEATGAEAQLEALINSAVQKSANGKTRQQIAVEVYQTPEGRRLCNEATRERRV